MTTPIHFNATWLEQITKNPATPFKSKLGSIPYTANIVIPHYRDKVRSYFKDQIDSSLEQECKNINSPMPFEHFGVSISFESPIEVHLYDENSMLNKGLSEIIAKVGPIILKNTYFSSAIRDDGHRNRFPQFQFHVDRSPMQDTRYSLYTRNPFCPEQKHPRTASTIFTTNSAAYLQAIKQGLFTKDKDKRAPTSNLLFEKEPLETILGNVILEQRWDEPEGVGEIAMIDNATVLHASFYRDAAQSGYRIGVRYLAGL